MMHVMRGGVPADPLNAMLVRLQLPGIRDQLDNLFDEAARAKLVSRRYKTGAMLITSNRSVAE